MSRTFASLLLLSVGGVSSAGALMPLATDLRDARWKAKAGDDPRWAGPDYDDSGWQAVEVPRGLRAAGVHSSDGLYWYRVELPALQGDGPWALLLGRVCEAEEIFLNGRLIGGEGSLGKRWHDYVGVCRKTRFVSIPPGLLEATAPNLLAIRVFSLHVDAGIYSGDVAVGRADHLLARAVAADRAPSYFDVFKISLVLLQLLFVAGVRLVRARSEEPLWLPAIMIILAAIYVVESLPFYDAGLRSSWIQRLDLIPLALLPSVIMLHADATLGLRTRRWQLALGAAVLLPALALQLDMPIETARRVFSALMVLALPVLAVTTHRLVRGVRMRVPRAGLLLAGVASGLLGLSGFMFGLGFLPPWNIEPFEVGLFGLLVAFLAAFVLTYRRDRQELERLSLGILQVRDAERNRLARELHDGLGQRLVMTRFRLEAAAAGRGEGSSEEGVELSLEEPIEELRESSAELRSMIDGLMPSTLDRAGLVAAMRSYGGRRAELSGARLIVWAQGRPHTDAHIEQHLFRIFQEALHNALRHGSACRLLVRLYEAGDTLRLEVRDNGVGFDPERCRGDGLGLSTMAQRARLCGGRWTVYSRPGRGARVVVTLPREAYP